MKSWLDFIELKIMRVERLHPTVIVLAKLFFMDVLTS